MHSRPTFSPRPRRLKAPRQQQPERDQLHSSITLYTHFYGSSPHLPRTHLPGLAGRVCSVRNGNVAEDPSYHDTNSHYVTSHTKRARTLSYSGSGIILDKKYANVRNCVIVSLISYLSVPFSTFNTQTKILTRKKHALLRDNWPWLVPRPYARRLKKYIIRVLYSIFLAHIRDNLFGVSLREQSFVNGY